MFATIAMSIRWRGSRHSLEFPISVGHVPRHLACTYSGTLICFLYAVYPYARLLVQASMQHSILSCSPFSTGDHAAFMLNCFLFEQPFVLKVRCGTMAEQMLKCSRCKFMRYCSAQCQRSDWRAHKLQCDASLWPRERRAGRSHFFGMMNGYDYDRWFFTLFEELP